MKKEDCNKPRYCIQHDDHPKTVSTILCSMMEHQSLVDLAIRCGNNTIHVHKAVIAANSSYFREQLEKNMDTEQIVINGLDFAIVKAIIEFMYCGETNILEDQLKYMIAASKLFKIRGLQTLESDTHNYGESLDEFVHIPPPTFLSKKPKYSSTYLHFNNLNMNNMDKNLQNDPNFCRKIKRKYMRSEAERACAKEAAASRLALEALQKELATTSQVSSFVIEESCTETTVENFIPHTEEPFIDNLNQISGVPLQVVNYDPSVLTTSSQIINTSNPIGPYVIPTNMQKVEDTTAEKIKHILGKDIPSNVEIMFKTSDGNFVSVTDEVLQNITRGSLQYQVIDENGQAGELQELQVDKPPVIQSESNQPFEDTVDSFVNTEHSVITSTEDSGTMEDSENKSDDNSLNVMQNSDDNEKNKDFCNDMGEEYKTENLSKRSNYSLRKLRTMNVYDEFKQPDFECSEFMISEHSGSCPTFVPTTLNRDPLSEACDIAENLSHSESLKHERLFPDVSFPEITENMINTESIDNKFLENQGDCKTSFRKSKFLIKDNLSVENESNYLECSPRKLRSSKQIFNEAMVDQEDVEKYLESDKKRLLSNRKKK